MNCGQFDRPMAKQRGQNCGGQIMQALISDND
jgi:hypothetical protein